MGKYLKKVWLVGTRDYFELIQSKMFWIGTVSVPIVIIGIGLVSAFATIFAFSDAKSGDSADIAAPSITDIPTIAGERNRGFSDDVRIDEAKVEVEKFLDALRSTRVKQDDPLLNSLQATIKSYSKAETNEFIDQAAESIALTSTTDLSAADSPQKEFVELWRTHPERLKALIKAKQTDSKDPTRDVASKQKTNKMVEEITQTAVPTVLALLMWMMIFMSSFTVMTNTVEEKSSRLYEVILSSVSAGQLMDGKTVGVALSSLTTLSAWIGSAFVVSLFGYAILGELVNGIVGTILAPALWIAFLFYFITGYLFYAALFSAIGASCTTLRETQALSMPITIVLAAFMLLFMVIIAVPNHPLVVFVSYVPLLTPFIMMARIAGSPALWEYFTTGSVMLISLYFTRILCIRIYEKGILSFGPAPTFRKMASMLRESRS